MFILFFSIYCYRGKCLLTFYLPGFIHFWSRTDGHNSPVSRLVVQLWTPFWPWDYWQSCTELLTGLYTLHTLMWNRLSTLSTDQPCGRCYKPKACHPLCYNWSVISIPEQRLESVHTMACPPLSIPRLELDRAAYSLRICSAPPLTGWWKCCHICARTASVWKSLALISQTWTTQMMLCCSLQTHGIGVTYSAVTRTRPAQWVCTQTGWKPKSRTLAPVWHQRWFQCTVRLLNLWWNSLISDQTLTLKVIPRPRSTDVLVWEIPSWASWTQSGGSRSLACKQSSAYIHPLVLSVVLYGSETWTLRKSDSDRLQSFHMTSQRRILGIRWFEHVTNASIQETTGLMNLSLIIADRRHDLFGHVCRLPPETPVRRALQLCTDIFNGDRPTPEWKRPRGRPRRSWLQQIEEDFGAPISVAYIAAQDRSSWRSLRPSAGLAHQWVSEWVTCTAVVWQLQINKRDSIQFNSKVFATEHRNMLSC